MNKNTFAALLVCTLAFATPVLANDTAATDNKAPSTMEKTKAAVKEGYEDTRDGAKKAYRGAKDKACEMVNGKLECLPQKAGSAIKNGVEKAKDKAND